MPIVHKIATSGGVVVSWKITETFAELQDLVNSERIPPPQLTGHELRQKQQMIIQLLHNFLSSGFALTYNQYGKPEVNNGQYVSISHSGEYVVMMLASFLCGVDIEKITGQVRRIRSKFLNDDELASTETANETVLTKYWTAKEAMFKVHGTDKVFLRSNIFVEFSEERCVAILKDGELEMKRSIRFEQIDNLLLAWTEPYDEA